MTYFEDPEYQRVWREFHDRRLSMTKRDAVLDPKRERLYAVQFPRKRTVKKIVDRSMRKTEMRELAAMVQQKIDERKARR